MRDQHLSGEQKIRLKKAIQQNESAKANIKSEHQMRTSNAESKSNRNRHDFIRINPKLRINSDKPPPDLNADPSSFRQSDLKSEQCFAFCCEGNRVVCAAGLSCRYSWFPLNRGSLLFGLFFGASENNR